MPFEIWGPGTGNDWALRLVYDGSDPICCAEVDKVRADPKLAGRVSYADTTAAGYDASDPMNAGLDFETAENRIVTVHRVDGEYVHYLEEQGVGAFHSGRHAWFVVDSYLEPLDDGGDGDAAAAE